MKTHRSTPGRCWNTVRSLPGLPPVPVVNIALGLVLLCAVTAFAGDADASPVATPTAASHAPATATGDGQAGTAGATLLPEVAGVIRLAEAGVSAEVITAYVEAAPVSGPLTEADIIALKQKSVGDEVTKLLLRRGAVARVAVIEARQAATAQAVGERRLAAGGFDPEGYDYFQYYHLQPRTMASARERLYGGPGARRYGWGYRYGTAYGPGFPGRPPHHRGGWGR